ncbi:MAG TPA: RNA polymerase sigma factor [Sporichthyaceae bacterium]|nr:RNA polymerase sigma factor [Sporichthyaceae bacterium]
MSAKQPFDAVVTTHGPTILRVCRAVLGPADADDAWADTFLSALEAYPRLPADANVEAWLVTIAHRKTIDLLRRAARQAVPVAELTATANTTDPGQLDLDLTRALAELPDKQRFCVVYHHLIGLPYDEVAEILGGTAAAARRAAADGIAKLRTMEGLTP